MRHRAGPPPNRIRTKSPSGGRRRGNSAARKEKVRGRLRPLDFAIMKGRGQGANQIPLKFVAFGDRNLAASGAASPFPFAEPRLILKPGPVPFLGGGRHAPAGRVAPVPGRPLRRRVCPVAPAVRTGPRRLSQRRHPRRAVTWNRFPVYVDRAAGGRKWTVEGKELIDYWSGHGALLLGHSHPAVVEAVQRQMARATHPGACHEARSNGADWFRASGAVGREGALHVVGHRGDADGPAAGADLHRPAEGAEVRRPLPRLARLPHPGRRRALRRRDAARRPGRGRRPDRRRAAQRCRAPWSGR